MPAESPEHADDPHGDGRSEPALARADDAARCPAWSVAGLVRPKGSAPPLTAATGLATIAAFALFHALPAATSVTEPYWGHHGSASGAQVASLALIGLAAVWVVGEVLLAMRSGDQPAGRQVAPPSTVS